MHKLLITIDGPAGAGKTTVSRTLADRLGYRYIDTGALYRAVAHIAAARGVAPQDDAGLSALLERLTLNFLPGSTGQRLTANGVDITDAIRTPEISMLASAVSARAAVRAFLLKIQRELGRQKAAVFEGRDMGTVVFPEADAKFFLNASAKIRAQRRFAEMKAQSTVSVEAVERDMQLRDLQDSTRTLAPLQAAPDAVMIDSTALAVDQVVERMLSHVRAVLGRS